MTASIKRCLSSFLILIIVFSSVYNVGPLAASNDLGSDKITLYHTNDIHGKVESKYDSNGNLVQIGFDILKTIKNSTQNSLLLDSGDITQGSILASYSKGSDIIDLMGEVGYDVMGLGNHDFDYGAEQVLKNAEKAKFPVISANTYLKESNAPLLKDINFGNGCNVIKEVAGKRIGIFSLLTPETAYRSKPENTKLCEFKDVIEIAKQQVEILKNENVDLIVCLSHIGVDDSSEITSVDVAQQINGIDVILDGHSHSVMNEKVNDTLIQQIGTGSKNVGKLEIEIVNGKIDINYDILSAKKIGEVYKADQEITDLYNKLSEDKRPLLERVIGRTDSKLYGGSYEGKSISRMAETNLGLLVADAMLWEANKLLSGNDEAKNLDLVVLQNGGGVRSTIDGGFITVDDVESIDTNGNSLSVKKVTPKDLYSILENGVSKLNPPKSQGDSLTGPDGRFPQVAGMRVEYDITKEPYVPGSSEGERVTKIVLLNADGSDGKVLDRLDTNTQIGFVSNDFENSAGDGYLMLKDHPVLAEGDVITNIIAAYINKLTIDGGGRFSYPFKQERLKLIKQDNLYSNYNATITVLEESAIVDTKSVKVSVDNGQPAEMTTNELGQIFINDLSSGMHNIRVEYNGKLDEVYVNEEAGIKSAIIKLEDKSQKNVKCTINIISQIPGKVCLEDKGIIDFARQAYDSLTNSEKQQVWNYNELQDAERKLAGLDKPMNSVKDTPMMAVIFIFSGIVISILAVVIVKKYKAKKAGI